jgi:hypothetical protein
LVWGLSVPFSFKYLFQQGIIGTQFFFERMMDGKLSPIHRSIPFDHAESSEMVEIVKDQLEWKSQVERMDWFGAWALLIWVGVWRMGYVCKILIFCTRERRLDVQPYLSQVM